MKTNIIIEEYNAELISFLDKSKFNVYHGQALFAVGFQKVECYTEYLSGDHIVVCGKSEDDQFVLHGENGMFYIDHETYVYASEFGWQLLKVTEETELGNGEIEGEI